MKKQNDRGFSLVELMVVVVMIAVLSTVAVAHVSNNGPKNRDRERVADTEILARRLEDYFSGTGQGRYPATVEMTDTAWIKANLTSLDLEAIKAPGGAENSIIAANNTTWNPARDVTPLPTATTYVYQPRTVDDALCEMAGAKCVNFSLFWYEEVTGEVVLRSSFHQ